MSALKALFGFVLMMTCGLPVLAGDAALAPAGAPAEPAKAPAAVTSTTPMPMPVVQPKFEEYVSTVIIKGKWGDKPGEFGLGMGMGAEGENVIPDEIACDDAGNVYVADRWNNRIQKFDNKGKFTASYNVGLFVDPTDSEFESTFKSWNKTQRGFVKIKAKGLLWVDGHLYITQKTMPDLHTGKYEENVLVLKNDSFVPLANAATSAYMQKLKTRSFYKDGSYVSELVDYKKNRYVNISDKWEKFDSTGKKLFEFSAFQKRKTGKSHLYFFSSIVLVPDADCYLEMRVFATGEVDPNYDWDFVFFPNGGGMQVTKWCKK